MADTEHFLINGNDDFSDCRSIKLFFLTLALIQHPLTQRPAQQYLFVKTSQLIGYKH